MVLERKKKRNLGPNIKKMQEEASDLSPPLNRFLTFTQAVKLVSTVFNLKMIYFKQCGPAFDLL